MSKEFLYDENLVCDCCNGLKKSSSLCCHSLRLDPEGEETLAQEFSKKYLTFDNCSHKICFHCIADLPSAHGKPLHKIECIQCKKPYDFSIKPETDTTNNSNYALNYALNYNILRIFSRFG
jgi:hypothetical protein